MIIKLGVHIINICLENHKYVLFITRIIFQDTVSAHWDVQNPLYPRRILLTGFSLGAFHQKLPAMAVIIAAPVGVTSSPFESVEYTGMPRSISAVAGAGTGNFPWEKVTKPEPTLSLRTKDLFNTKFFKPR
jgi:hypothetical protein